MAFVGYDFTLDVTLYALIGDNYMCNCGKHKPLIFASLACFVGSLTTTIYMGKFLLNWEIVQSCKHCKSDGSMYLCWCFVFVVQRLMQSLYLEWDD